MRIAGGHEGGGNPGRCEGSLFEDAVFGQHCLSFSDSAEVQSSPEVVPKKQKDPAVSRIHLVLGLTTRM